MGRFEDRVAVVTGAGSGLGAAIATRLATEGASVVCVDLTDAAAAGTAQLLGDRGRAVRVDVADGGDVACLLGEVREGHGRLAALDQGGRGQVPGPPVRLPVPVEDGGERPVGRQAGGEGGAVVGRRADQRVAELELEAGDPDQPDPLQRLRADVKGRPGGEHGGQLPGVLGGRDRQQRLGLGGGSRTCCRNAAWTLPVRGMCSGSGSRPASWPALSVCGSSSRARGLPPVSSTSRSLTMGLSLPNCASSSRPAASVSSPPTGSSGRPGAWNRRTVVSQAATSSATRSWSSRRPTNTRASAEARSSHWASLTSNRTGRSSWCRAAKACSTSDSTPKARSRWKSPACPPGKQRYRIAGRGWASRMLALGPGRISASSKPPSASINRRYQRRGRPTARAPPRSS
jgi:short chain dehydrogenase